MPLLLFLFIVVPIAEMWLLIKVGGVIGAFNTIGLVLLTAVVGLALLRQQGFSTLLRMNQRMEQGEMPATEVIEGIVLAVGGALLLTPGFITDAVGFLCLIPPTRRWLIRRALKQGGGMIMRGQFRGGSFHATRTDSELRGRRDGHNTIDGEYRREDD